MARLPCLYTALPLPEDCPYDRGISHFSTLSGIKHRIVTDVPFGGHKLAEIFEDANGNALDCNLLGDRDLIEAALKFVPDNLVTKVMEDEMYYFIDKCYNRTLNEPRFRSIFSYISSIFKSLLIFPGTKWCGAGNVARNYDDMGYLNSTDTCCRNHDHSHDKIKAFREKYGIRNRRFYTMTHCVDDRAFYYCLLNDGTIASATVGNMFFNILKTTCFIETYPKKCVRRNW
ncbi:phospholipase A2 heteromtoxin-like [Ornithodoros turicata]|uniref:phospholipase A2 heteromtoxin-like n=1 Tax=Ornithodoros turicata TaxID=34597 RepID=UPI0031397387